MENTIRMTVVYDNNSLIHGLEEDWGFGCVITINEQTMLFDTGDNGNILLRNMDKLNINPQNISTVFLSHYHHDHTGGLEEFLKINSNVRIYYLHSFPIELVDTIIRASAIPVPVSEFVEIFPNVFSLGVIDGNIPEQSLAIRSSQGIVIITGCAHPGILTIVENAKAKFPDELIFLVTGGFHMHRKNEDEINEVIQKMFDMDILSIAPTHCSGSAASKMFREVFDADFLEVGVGKVIELK